MAQTSASTTSPSDNKTPPNLGAQAAAAATIAPKPSAAAAGPATPTTQTTAAGDSDGDSDGNVTTELPDEINRNKIYIVVGQIQEFATPAKAEKFLNSAGAPVEYSIIRGKQVTPNKKVTLR